MSAHLRAVLRPGAAVLLLALLLAQGCVSIGDDGMGGTGIGAEDDGIGGTGLRAALDPDGIGGTGIVGEIHNTTVGAIHVAGLTVAVADSTMVRRAGRHLGRGALANGQIVAVLARKGGDGLTAREIRILDALVGKVTQVDGQHITVLGQQLRVDAARTRVAPPLHSPSAIKVGQRVIVSGLWRPSGELLVTRVEAAPAIGQDALFAPVSAVSGERLYVGKLEVRGRKLANVQPGDYVMAAGTAAGTVLQVSALHASTRLPFGDRVARVIVDGFPGSAAHERVSIGAVSAVLPAASPLRTGIASAAREGQRMIASAVVRGGAAEIRQLRPVTAQRPVRDTATAPRVVVKPPLKPARPEPVRPERPVLPAARPVLPARPPILDVPVRPPVIERPSPIDTRPVDIRPQPRPVDIRPNIDTPSKVLR